MMKRFLPAVALLLVGASGTYAHAAVPTTYKGMPYHGTPSPIPGRINLADYDLGGTNVSYNTNHTAPATSAPSYRTDTDHALIYVTSEVGGLPNNPVPDKYTAGPLMGTVYPGSGVKDYYIGATHPGDWVAVTVNVMTAGMYQISSTWASGGPSIDYKIFVNDLTRTTPLIEVTLPTTGDYHNWVPDVGPHVVQLNSGVQLLTFQTAVQHLNFDYLQFSLVTADGGVDPGNPEGGVSTPPASDAGTDDATPDGAASSGAATGSGAGTSGATSGDVSGAGSGSSSGSATVSGSAMSGSALSGASGGGAQGGGAASAPNAPNAAGCGCSTLGANRSAGGMALALALMGGIVGRARKHRARS